MIVKGFNQHHLSTTTLCTTDYPHLSLCQPTLCMGTTRHIIDKCALASVRQGIGLSIHGTKKDYCDHTFEDLLSLLHDYSDNYISPSPTCSCAESSSCSAALPASSMRPMRSNSRSLTCGGDK